MVLNTGNAGIVTIINVDFNYIWSGFKLQIYLSAFHLFLFPKHKNIHPHYITQIMCTLYSNFVPKNMC